MLLLLLANFIIQLLSKMRTTLASSTLNSPISRSSSVYTQWAHHGQATFKQRCIDVTDVQTTLFRRRLTMTCPLGNFIPFIHSMIMMCKTKTITFIITCYIEIFIIYIFLKKMKINLRGKL